MSTQPEPTTTGLTAIRARRADRIEDIEWMAATGETVPGAAARLRIHPHRLREVLAAADRRDLYARLLANQDQREYAGPRASIRRPA